MKSPLRFADGAGLSFASAADEAFACSLSLGGGAEEGGNRRAVGPLLLRCLGGRVAWEAAGERAAEAFLQEAAERRREEEAEVRGVSGESGSSSSSSSSGIGSLSEAGGDGTGRKAAEASPVPPTAGTEA